MAQGRNVRDTPAHGWCRCRLIRAFFLPARTETAGGHQPPEPRPEPGRTRPGSGRHPRELSRSVGPRRKHRDPRRTISPHSERSWAAALGRRSPPRRGARSGSPTGRRVSRTVSPLRPSLRAAVWEAVKSHSAVSGCSPRGSPPRPATTARPASGAPDGRLPAAPADIAVSLTER